MKKLLAVLGLAITLLHCDTPRQTTTTGTADSTMNNSGTGTGTTTGTDTTNRQLP